VLSDDDTGRGSGHHRVKCPKKVGPILSEKVWGQAVTSHRSRRSEQTTFMAMAMMKSLTLSCPEIKLPMRTAKASTHTKRRTRLHSQRVSTVTRRYSHAMSSLGPGIFVSSFLEAKKERRRGRAHLEDPTFPTGALNSVTLSAPDGRGAQRRSKSSNSTLDG
jgi:hypothetical protein